MSSAGVRLRTASDVVAVVRRSLVSVRGPSSGGTGWVALANGLVMTSHEAVGYASGVVLELESGRQEEGRVVWADVARDLALVLPGERLPLPPLLPRPDLPRLGEPVLALGAVPDAPWRVVSAVVSAVDYRVGPIRCFELDAALTSRGGPVVDLDGRVIGVGGLDLPRGSGRHAEEAFASTPAHPSPPNPGTERRSLAIPIAALARALAAADVSAEQFEGRAPTYRCPACGEPFEIPYDRCLACGRLLPHGFDPAGATAAAERIVRDMLDELAAVATSVRVGPRAYRISAPTADGAIAHVDLAIDESGACIRGKIAVLRVPAANQEPFYRFLLTLNDQAPGTHRFSVEGDVVYLSFVEPTALVRPGEGSAHLHELLREGARYRKALAEPFEAP